MRRIISFNRQRILTGLACSAVSALAWVLGATPHVLGALVWSTVFLTYFEVTRWWKKSKGFPPNPRAYFNRSGAALGTGAAAFAVAWYFGAEANALWVVAMAAVASGCLHHGRGEIQEEWEETELLRVENGSPDVDESDDAWLRWVKSECPEASDDAIRTGMLRRVSMSRRFG